VAIKITMTSNTHGPKMNLSGTRLVSNFIVQVLKSENISIFFFVMDFKIDILVAGLIRR